VPKVSLASAEPSPSPPLFMALPGAARDEGEGAPARGQENGGLLDFDCASLRYRQRVLHTGAEAPKTLPQFLPVRER